MQRTKRQAETRRIPSAAGSKYSGLEGVGWRWVGLSAMVATLFIGVQPVMAASLDDQIKFLLENSCTELTLAGGTPTGNLAVLCAGGGGAGTSSGGDAGTPATAPGIVQKRLQTARGEKEGATQTGEKISEITPGLNVFLAAEGESLDRDVTAFEDGYDSTIWRFTAGGDYQFTTRLTGGAAFTYYNHDGDYSRGGDFDNDSYGVTFFASLLPVDQAFVQATVGYAAKSYDRTRIAFFQMGGSSAGPGPANGDYDGDEYSAGIQAGYDYTVGGLTIGPRLGLDYVHTKFDSYRESGATGLELVFADASQTSVQSRVGLAGSMAISTGFGVLQPQASVSWVHEFQNDQRSEGFSFADDSSAIPFSFQNEPPDRNFYEFGIGAAAILPNGWQPFAQVRTTAGHAYLDSWTGTIGLRIEL